jgi:hypothetical protein
VQRARFPRQTEGRPSSLVIKAAFMPEVATVGKDDLVPITPWRKPISAQHIWRWLTAVTPLVKGMEGPFIHHALPSWERERRLKGLADDGDD